MRRLDRLRAKGLLQPLASADGSCNTECTTYASNEELFEAAMNLLRDINKV